MTVTNKRLLIFESRDDLNRCTPYRGKPDQQDTYASHASPCTPGVRFLREIPVRGNLSWGADRFWQIPLLLRKRAPDTIHNTPGDWSADPYPASLPSQPMKQGHKPSSWRWPTTRFTRHISLACDRYVQYLLMGGNRTVINQHRRGLQPWRCWFATYPLSDLPNQLSPLSPNGPVRTPF
jgi:hypothetical protein